MKSPLLRSIGRMLEAGRSQKAPASEGLTRRELLTRASAGAGAFLAHEALAGFPAWMRAEDPIAIVGAGVAGLTAAYRLTKAGIPCEIFEASGRLGGRMHTLKNFNSAGQFVELGGELIDSTHDSLLKLAAELGLAIDDFTAGDAGLAPELYYAGGRLRSEAELIEAFKPLGEVLAEDIDSISEDGELVTPTYQNPMGEAGKRLDRLSLKEYLDARRSRVEGWVLDLVERAFVGEFGGDACDQSALNLLVLIDPSTEEGVKFYGASDESKRIRGGNERLPEALHKAIAGKVRVHLGSPLVDLRDRGLCVRLTFARPGGGLRTLYFKRALMAVPFSTLRRVDGLRSLALSPQKRRSIQELGYGTNAKLMLGFQRRFWREATPKVPASSGELFWDINSHEVWETSREQAGAAGVLTSFLGGRAGVRIDPQLASHTLRDLDLVHDGRASRNFDGRRVLRAWAHGPYSRGSYTCPKPGQYTGFIGSEGEPELSGRLLFAGEHCSVTYQGYMNGAVESGETAAAAIVKGRSALPARASASN